VNVAAVDAVADDHEVVVDIDLGYHGICALG
jgi:hypothetical protein